jgi:hypothetical protein
MMKKFLNLISGLLLVLFFFPLNVLAYNDWGMDVKIFSLFDVFFDILGFSVAVAALSIGLELLRKLTGKFRTTWIYCMMTILIFLIIQAMTLISAFYSIDFSGIFPIIKFIMGLMFLIAVLVARSMIQQIVRNKSLKEQGRAPKSES